MKVLKFGGTSVGTVDSLKNVKKIVDNIRGNAVVVVSALGGLTDHLISTANKAASGEGNWAAEYDSIRNRHLFIIDTLIPASKKDITAKNVEELLGKLRDCYAEVERKGELSEQDLNKIVSFGERMSSFIVADLVENGKRYFSPDFIKTERWYDKNIAERKKTENLIKETFKNIGDEEKAIVPGFISTDHISGEITNLGRGGSDYTGALIAAALDAEVLEIWTDVDGFMTADPRIVKEALLIDHLTFAESMELCNFGAKVVYPPTIYPVFHNNIPIKILNTFNLSAPGTLITDETLHEDFDVKGVSVLKNLSLISIRLKTRNDNDSFALRAYNVLSKKGISIIPLANSEIYDKLDLAVNNSDTSVSLDLLAKEFEEEITSGQVSSPEYLDNLAAIAVVGKDMRNRFRLGSRIRHSLSRDGIQVYAFSDNSETTQIFMIKQEESPLALPLVHSLIF